MRLKFKSLKQQITVIFLALILAIQLAGLIPIELSINKNAHTAAEKDLRVGESVFLNILEHNTESLKQGAKILAADYGFRDAIASNDNETIMSALNNHQARIKADIAVFYASSSKHLILSGNLTQDDARSVAEKLISEYADNRNQLDFEIFNGSPYQLVAVPIKAPLTIGWIVMGFEINNDIASQLHKLSNLDVTFIQKTAGGDWTSAATTLSNSEVNTLLANWVKNDQSAMKKMEMEIEDNLYDARVLPLHQGKHQLFTVLQRSLSESTAQYMALKISLFVLIIIGLVIFTLVTLYISKLITQPITALSQSAKAFEQGDYAQEITTDRQDEIGDLSRAFGAMRKAIVLREQKVTRLAFWDEVTGLPNRAAFMKQLGEAIQTSQQSGVALSVIVLNIDRFKQINKILGRTFGDTLLKRVGMNLQLSVRKTTDMIARLGADDFAILLTRTDLKEALLVANKLLKTFEIPQHILDQRIDVTAGVGIATYHDDNSDEQLLHNAETALQVSKSKRVGLVVYEPAMDNDADEHLILATELKEAIQNNQLQMYLQPKINIATKHGYAAEALIRWQHPEKGMIYPDQFVPFAEQTGLIQKITLWMINEACRVISEMQWQGIKIVIAVNISARDLIDPDLPEKIADLLNKHQTSVDALTLEITESSMMDDPVRAEVTLHKLAQMGLNIAIDDFGTGYSSLAYLKRLPVQALKIDKSFVMNMVQDENDAVIVRSTIDLGHNLNLKVVAEGIENSVAWDMLAAMGCDDGQGYFMGKPMPVKEYAAWLRQWQLKVAPALA